MSAQAKLARLRDEVGAVRDTRARFFRLASMVGGGSETPTQGGECAG